MHPFCHLCDIKICNKIIYNIVHKFIFSMYTVSFHLPTNFFLSYKVWSSLVRKITESANIYLGLSNTRIY